jgi:autotransporter family porin
MLPRRLVALVLLVYAAALPVAGPANASAKSKSGATASSGSTGNKVRQSCKVRTGKARAKRRAHRLCVARAARKAATPDTRITAGPGAGSTSTSATASFSFTSTLADSAFTCSLDGGPYAACTSPKVLSGLANGAHTFRVRATKAGRTDSSPASRSWTVAVATATPTATPTPAPTATPSPTATPAPAPILGKAVTRPPGSAPLSDADAAARVVRSPFEPRPGNYAANHRVPTAGELATYRAVASMDCATALKPRITGNFTGTTDEIIQWVAHKWGIDEEVVRATATHETYWRQEFIGDAGESFGIMQVRAPYHAGTYPLSQLSTPFNLDYFGMIIRYYYNGCGTWLNDFERGQQYAAGDLWGSIGAWNQGRWHLAGGESYVTNVKEYMAARTWATPYF